jgi:hypothetical protein
LARNGKLQKFKSTQDKGHRQELQLTVEAIRSGKPSPISFEELVEVSHATLLVQQALATGETIRLVAPPLDVPAEASSPEYSGPFHQAPAPQETAHAND